MQSMPLPGVLDQGRDRERAPGAFLRALVKWEGLAWVGVTMMLGLLPARDMMPTVVSGLLSVFTEARREMTSLWLSHRDGE